MSYSLNFLKGGSTGDYMGITIGVIKGDTRSLDYISCECRLVYHHSVFIGSSAGCVHG